MKVGDIVQFDGQFWRVETHDRMARVCKLRSWEGTLEEVPDNLEDTEAYPDLGPLSIHASPSDDWPFVAAPQRSGAGAVVEVIWNSEPLRPMEDWVPSSRLRQGGSLFFNPELGLRRGDVLLAVHKSGRRTRVDITGGFGTIKRRKAGRVAPRPRRANRAAALLENDPFEGSDL